MWQLPSSNSHPWLYIILLCSLLWRLVLQGRTLICTIHQPSWHLFNMFDHLLLLVKGGKTVYFGETGEDSAALVAYFNGIPNVPQHNGTQNPATWMLNVLAMDSINFPEVLPHHCPARPFARHRRCRPGHDACLPHGTVGLRGWSGDL